MVTGSGAAVSVDSADGKLDVVTEEARRYKAKAGSES